MHCPRCQRENRPQAKFCEECGTPLTANPSAPSEPSYAEITSALSEALEQQRATAELPQTRNRELLETQEQQTATSEVLKIISRSTFDLQPVLETLIENATRLGNAKGGSIFRFDGELARLAAM
jgi:two-component system NtrC family sensor kinase